MSRQTLAQQIVLKIKNVVCCYLVDTKIDNKIKLAKMWNGKISYINNKLNSSIYPTDTLIFHYGNPNFNHPAIVSAMVDLGIKRPKFLIQLLFYYEIILSKFDSFKRRLKKLILFIFNFI